MSANCLVTRLKASVGDTALGKLGVFSFNVVASDNWSGWNDTQRAQACILGIRANEEIKVKVSGGGYFGNSYATIETDHLTEKTIPANVGLSLYFANVDSLVEIENKYALTQLSAGGYYDVKSIFAVDVSKCSELPNLATLIIFGSAFGDVSALKDHPALTRCGFTNSINLSGDVSELDVARFGTSRTSVYGNFTKLLEAATNAPDAISMVSVACPANKVVSADFSKASAVVSGSFSPGPIATKDIIGTWTTTRASDRYILNFAAGNGYYVDFGDDVNAMLVNQAACVVPSSGSKNMYIKGNYNPDYSGVAAAVATLKSAGYNITINGVTL